MPRNEKAGHKGKQRYTDGLPIEPRTLKPGETLDVGDVTLEPVR